MREALQQRRLVFPIMKIAPQFIKSIALVACLGLSVVPGVSLHGKDKKPAKGNNKKGAAPTPASLVEDMKASVVYIAKNAGDISPKSKQARPFWGALQTIANSLDQMEAGIKGKNADMLKGLDGTGRGITQLAATWGIIRGAHPKSTVGRGVVSLSAAYEMFVEHFGPAVASYKQGGGKKGKLTPKEVALIEKSAGQLEGLLAHLEQVAAKAKAKSYQARMIQDLLSLIADLADIEGTDRRAYAKFLYQWDRLEYALAAYSEIVQVYYPDFYTSWQALDADCTAMGSYFTTEIWGYYESWDYTSISIENYDAYYEETAIVASVTESEESQYEESLEAYQEESATEESTEEEEEVDEEVAEAEEDDDTSLFEEVEDSTDDEDGDGVSDEEDTDDDNDGVADAEDTDDDGDGLDDEEDADDEEEEEEEEDDDDGIAEDCEGCCC